MKNSRNTVSIDVHNRITPAKLQKLIISEANALLKNPSRAAILPPIMIWGPPGCAKSSIVKACAEKLGIEFHDVRLAQMEPCDIRGIPVPDKETKSMDWYVNGSWPRDPNGKGIIFLDELSAADRSVAVASYELILDRKLGKLYQVPPGYLIVAAGNRVEDRAVATTMPSALANRMMHVELEANAEDWLNWAPFNNIHPSVIGFIRFKPDMLFRDKDQNRERGWPTPRSWHRVSEMCHIAEEEGIDNSLLKNIVYGLVGDGAGVEFMAFHKLNAKFADVLTMMTDPNAVIQVPTEADKCWAFCSTMNYLLWRGDTDEEQKKRLDGFMRISMELTSDFAAMTMTSAMQGIDRSKMKFYCDSITKHPLFKDWQKKHTSEIMKYKKQFAEYGIK